MRKSPTLDALFTPPRRGILAATLIQPERWWYQSDLARHLGVHHATIQRELARLSQAEILSTRRDGNRVYYRANRESPVFSELRALVTKTAGHAETILDALKPFVPTMDIAFIHGSIARGVERAASDVDLMIIGGVTLKAIAKAIRSAEDQLGRPINPHLYSAEDFALKIAASNHFLLDVMTHDKIFLVGNADDLEKLAQGRTDRGARAGRIRARRSTTGR